MKQVKNHVYFKNAIISKYVVEGYEGKLYEDIAISNDFTIIESRYRLDENDNTLHIFITYINDDNTVENVYSVISNNDYKNIYREIVKL